MKTPRKHFSTKRYSPSDPRSSRASTGAPENPRRNSEPRSPEDQDEDQPPTGSLDLTGEYLWHGALAKAIDQRTIQRFGIPELVLMESAGRSVVQVIEDITEEEAPIIVLAGKGNNGADALVVARTLINLDYEVYVYKLEETDAHQGPPSASWQHQEKILTLMGVPLKTYQPGSFKSLKHREPIIVDGILGLGCRGPLSPKSLAWNLLDEANRIPDRTVVAIDIPSGMDPDQGFEQKIPLPADVTVTFGAKKPAHVIAPARDLCGEVIAMDIGLPVAAQNAVFDEVKPQWVIPDSDALIMDNPWSNLSRSSHKFDRGHVLVIGGSPGKTGAPLLSALAALRMGAGWASVALPSDVQKELTGDVPREITFEHLFTDSRLDTTLFRNFVEKRKVKAIVIGPGMMDSPLNQETIEELADICGKHQVHVTFDAGACLGLIPLLKQCHGYPHLWVATPHPGEWAKLGLPSDITPLNSAGAQKLQKDASDWGISLLYKHATPVFLAGDTHFPAFISIEGTNTLSRAGSGDLLAGLISAHGAIGLKTPEAVLRSLVVLAWAGKLAAKKRGAHGVLARDILDHIGRVDLLLDADEEEDEE